MVLVSQTQGQVDLAYSADPTRVVTYYDDDGDCDDDDATTEWASLSIAEPPSCDGLGESSEEWSVQFPTSVDLTGPQKIGE